MTRHLVLIDPDHRREFLARRLRDQGFSVEVHSDAISGANAVLAAPPDAVIADLWMPGVSGVPLTRLLTSEPATMGVPVILRATTDEPRNRFWARHAGAAGYVAKGRMGELVRALGRVISKADRDTFFLQLGNAADVRDRLAAHLDTALFESVLASEVRALGAVGSFGRLLDLLSQLLVQITSYRWLAIRTSDGKLGLHCSPEVREASLAEARTALGVAADAEVDTVEDDDAQGGFAADRPPLQAPIDYGGVSYGRLAISPTPRSDATYSLVELVARELGGPMRMVELVAETQRLAAIDALTGLLRRGPFTERVSSWLVEGRPLAILLVDLDRFKAINDAFGHGGGDRALVAAAGVVAQALRSREGAAARWGGEELVLALAGLDGPTALRVAEEVCDALRRLDLEIDGRRVPVTGSIGVAHRTPDDTPDSLVDRADRAMYAAKAAGRDRVCVADDSP